MENLSDERLKSIAIELDPDRRADHKRVKGRLLKIGFDLLTEEKFINREYIALGLAHNFFFVRK